MSEENLNATTKPVTDSAGSTLSGDEAFAEAWIAFERLGKLGQMNGETVIFDFNDWDLFSDSMNNALTKLLKYHEAFDL